MADPKFTPAHFERAYNSGLNPNTMMQLRTLIESYRKARATLAAWDSVWLAVPTGSPIGAFAARKARLIGTEAQRLVIAMQELVEHTPDTLSPGNAAAVGVGPRVDARYMVRDALRANFTPNAALVRQLTEEARRQTDPKHPLGPMYTE